MFFSKCSWWGLQVADSFLLASEDSGQSERTPQEYHLDQLSFRDEQRQIYFADVTTYFSAGVEFDFGIHKFMLFAFFTKDYRFVKPTRTPRNKIPKELSGYEIFRTVAHSAFCFFSISLSACHNIYPMETRFYFSLTNKWKIQYTISIENFKYVY